MAAAEVAFDRSTSAIEDSSNDDYVRRMAKAGVESFQQALVKDVEPPEELAHVLGWYNRLRQRNKRGWRFEPIPFSEIQAFDQLHGLGMTSFEVDILEKLDEVWQKRQPPPK